MVFAEFFSREINFAFFRLIHFREKKRKGRKQILDLFTKSVNLKEMFMPWTRIKVK